MTAQRLLEKAESLLDQPFAVDDAHRKETRTELFAISAKLEALDGAASSIPGFVKRLSAVRRELSRLPSIAPLLQDALDGRIVRHRDQKELLQVIARGIIDHYAACSSSQDLVGRVMQPYVRSGIAHRI